jgi:hypothetical protein
MSWRCSAIVAVATTTVVSAVIACRIAGTR